MFYEFNTSFGNSISLNGNELIINNNSYNLKALISFHTEKIQNEYILKIFLLNNAQFELYSISFSSREMNNLKKIIHHFEENMEVFTSKHLLIPEFEVSFETKIIPSISCDLESFSFTKNTVILDNQTYSLDCINAFSYYIQVKKVGSSFISTLFVSLKVNDSFVYFTLNPKYKENLEACIDYCHWYKKGKCGEDNPAISYKTNFEWNFEELINQSFNGYSNHGISKLISLRYNSQNKNTFNNLIIETEDEYHTQVFLEGLLSALYNINTDCKNIKEVSELNWNSSILCTTLILHIEYENTGYWNEILTFIEAHPEIFVIICSSPKTSRRKLQINEKTYYQLLPWHVQLKTLNAIDIYGAFVSSLNLYARKKNYRISENFLHEIKNYIEIVYPKARLRNNDFIEDLIERSFREADSGILTEKAVPFYKKPLSVSEIKEEFARYSYLDASQEIQNFVDKNIELRKLNLPVSYNLIFNGEQSLKNKFAELYMKYLFSLGCISSESLKIIHLSEDGIDYLKDLINQFQTLGVLYITDIDNDSELSTIVENHPNIVWILDTIQGDFNFKNIYFDSLSSSHIKDYIHSFFMEKGYEIDEELITSIGLNKKDKKSLDSVLITILTNHLDRAIKEKNITVEDIPNSLEKDTISSSEKNKEAVLSSKEGMKNDISSTKSLIISSKEITDELPEEITLSDLSKAYPTNPGNDYNHNKKVSNEDKNVIILGLSMFNQNRKYFLTKYSYPNNGSVEGYYQLEPVVKMIGQELNGSQKGIDQIIVIASDKTLIKNDVTLINKEKNKEFLLKNISALDLFVYSIKDWLKYNAKIVAICLPEEGTTVPYNTLQERIDSISLKKINVENSDKKTAITYAIREIRNIKKSNKLNLYVDTHGGLRGVQRSIDSILSLTKNEEINVAGVYSVEFSGSKNRIIKDEGYEDFNFVTGINEFLNSGRYEFLEKYRSESELIKIIKNISVGFQMCNIIQYEKGIEDLSKFNWDTISDPYIKLFADNIKNDYRKVLTSYGTHRTFEEMKWCFKKGFYQQLLTMVETKIPEILIKERKLILLDSNDQVKENYNDEEFKNAVELFNYKVQGKIWSFPGESLSKDEMDTRKIDFLNTYTTAQITNNNIRRLDWIFMDNNDENNRIKFDTISLTYEQKRQFYLFLKLHFSLKALRNNSNHLLSHAPNIDLHTVSKAIEKYFELFESLSIITIEEVVSETTISEEIGNESIEEVSEVAATEEIDSETIRNQINTLNVDDDIKTILIFLLENGESGKNKISKRTRIEKERIESLIRDNMSYFLINENNQYDIKRESFR